MPVYYFKKYSPENEVVLPPNLKIKFTSLNGLLGYYATNHESVASFLKQCIAEQRYGLSEITEVEFHSEYVDKKKAGILPSPVEWRREQIGASGLERGTHPLAKIGQEAVKVVALEGQTDIHRNGGAVTMEESNSPVASAPVPPPPKAPPAPTVGRRTKRR